MKKALKPIPKKGRPLKKVEVKEEVTPEVTPEVKEQEVTPEVKEEIPKVPSIVPVQVASTGVIVTFTPVTFTVT